MSTGKLRKLCNKSHLSVNNVWYLTEYCSELLTKQWKPV